MGEEAWLEWLKGISDQHAIIILAKPVTPELTKVATSERTNTLIYAAIN